MEEQQTQRTRRKFSDEFKRDGVEIVRSSDKSIAEMARELGIYDSSLGNWVAFFKPGHDPAKAWSGVRLFDVSDPTAPRELSHWAGSETKSYGVHRSWWNGGRYAYLSNMIDAPGVRYHWREGRTRVMTILDVSDPESPRHVSDFWHPVQLGQGPEALPGETFGVHLPVVDGDRAYVAYSDGGFGIVDVSDPEQASLVSHVRTFPELTDGQTHTCVPLRDRGILVVCEEPMANHGLEGPKNIRLWDISDETNPTEISTLPIPDPTPGEPYPTYYHKGERFGPHNMHENHQGSKQISNKVYNAYMNAGLASSTSKTRRSLPRPPRSSLPHRQKPSIRGPQ